MRAGHTAASGVRHVVGVGLQALIVAAIMAIVALTLSANYKPAAFIAGVERVQAAKVVASISFAGATARDASAGTLSFADPASFRVEADVSKASDLYKLWVANTCYQDGSLVSVEHLPVKDGIAGTFALGPAPSNGGPQGDWSGGAAECKAYVWLYPNSGTALRGATLRYSVGS